MNYPKTIGTFHHTAKKEFFFSTCKECGAKCCTGSENFVLAPLILEDFPLVFQYFPILFRVEEERVKASILLNDGENSCWYLQDSRCSIYENRPPTCRQYPISPYYESLYVDTSCPAVNREGQGASLVKDLKISQNFRVERFSNFYEKLQESEKFFDTLDKQELKLLLHIAGVDLFVYKGVSKNKFIQLHQNSIHLHQKLLTFAKLKERDVY